MGPSFEQHTILQFDVRVEELSAHPADMDGDGDMDVVSSALYAVNIVWWENLDGDGTMFDKHILDPNTALYYPNTGDVDGDGRMDIWAQNEPYWWQKQNSETNNWLKRALPMGTLPGRIADINGDGLPDLLAAPNNDCFDCASEGYWLEHRDCDNPDDADACWVVHRFSKGVSGASDFYPADVDGDGDQDIIGGGETRDGVTIWENVDALGTSWKEHFVSDEIWDARTLATADLDLDGDVDLIGANSMYGDEGNISAGQIVWWENLR
jgi:hypothetical protein